MLWRALERDLGWRVLCEWVADRAWLAKTLEAVEPRVVICLICRGRLVRRRSCEEPDRVSRTPRADSPVLPR